MALACRCAGSRLAVRNAQPARPMPLRSSVVVASRRTMLRSVVVRAAEEEPGSAEVDKVVKDLQEKWDKVENKTAVVLYGAGAVTLLWFSNTLVGALNSVPLLPKLMELVGLGYTSWFVYRYLLFKSSREELVKDVDELKKKITGETA